MVQTRMIWKLPDQQQLTQNMVRSAESALTLHVQSENIWVQFPEKLFGMIGKTEVRARKSPVPEGSGHWAARGSELVAEYQSDDGGKVVAHLDPASARSGKMNLLLQSQQHSLKRVPALPPKPRITSQLPITLGRQKGYNSVGNSKAIDPKTAAQRYENMPLPSKLALPAVLAANANQERLKAELRGDSDAQPARQLRRRLGQDMGRTFITLLYRGWFRGTLGEASGNEDNRPQSDESSPEKGSLGWRSLHRKFNGVANDLLNEMQRENVGDTVKEDISRYQVKLRKAGGDGEGWTGEVTGSPQFFPLKTVHILVAGDSVFAFDKNLKKLWDGKLSSKVIGGGSYDESLSESSQYGEGPCVERGDRLYLFDQTVLTAYEKTSGKPVWRLPSVGTAGLFFDEQGHIYVNTTTASPESVKYSRQIDISAKTRNEVIKLKKIQGKVLWRADGEGMISYLSGKFIYTMETYGGDSDEGSGFLGGMKTGLEIPAHVRIKRLSPAMVGCFGSITRGALRSTCSSMATVSNCSSEKSCRCSRS